MKKTITVMLKYFMMLFLSIMISCSISDNSYRNAKAFVEFNSNRSFDKFLNWDIYKRTGDVIVFDYLIDKKVTHRYLIKINDGYFIKEVFPKKDAKFNDLNADLDRSFFHGLSRGQLKTVIVEYLDLNLNRISFHEEYNALIFSNENFTILRTFGNQKENNIPKGYKNLNENWYYYHPDGRTSGGE